MNKVSSAHNHRMRPIDRQVRDIGHGLYQPNCQGCRNKPEFICEFDFDTGRDGKIRARSQYRCRPHALAFAAKHGLILRDAP